MQVHVRVGTSISSQGGDVLKVARVEIHPSYTIDSLSYDIAIVELETKLIYSNTVNKIDLPGDVELEPGTITNVTGFGMTEKKSRRLQAVQLPIVSREDCREVHGNEVTEDMICAGTGDKGVCYVRI